MNARRALTRRRQQDAQLHSIDQYVKESSKLKLTSDWENRTDERLKNQCERNRSKEEKELKQQLLEHRRSKLQALYQSELESWRQAIALNKNETPEERIERIREKAYRLKEQRERERQQYVAECYERQWRDACDDARTIDSKAQLEKLMIDRKNTVQAKRGVDAKEKAAEAEALRISAQKLREQEEKEEAARAEKNASLRRALDEQVTYVNECRNTLAKDKEREEMALLERWRSEEEDDKRQQTMTVLEAQKRGLEAVKFNQIRLEEKRKADNLERMKDNVLLQHAMAKEKNEIAQEVQKKEHAQESTRQYTRFLRDQMIREKANTSTIDAIRAEEMEKIWIKRDQELLARANARSRLMHEVQEGRIEQMHLKQAAREAEAKSLSEEARETMLKLAAQEEEEARRREETKAATVRNTEQIKAQMDHKQTQKEKENQEKYLLYKQIQYAERMHEERIAQQAGRKAAYFPKAQTSWHT
mmetsp:Transcript_2981/g.4283  ORF Transcript_2981/g.4283 Transcript_2981/m.4283 type:complete len:476 (-) Transcript_2981:1321-2748(-)|eukprot:CAMPEP_0116010988 /NCGR_PEP_ID=MMETSP0321-20121206/4311_1 /TAXON_ID=163516 /ORGANISM="Leptocylindrus danicus var. danicus, Strain B650" /LENGTH=475 /DNA_ID=CAMNT_0003480157 /DNA_START=182 /DNA_END=1609 /DNA_ORIENTATION=+